MAIKRIDKDFEVSIINNLYGSFYYSSPNGSLIIDMEERGDEDYVTFGDLKSLMSRNRKILTNLNLVINDVVGDEYTLKDVIDSLKLEDSYNELLSLADKKLSEVEYIDIELIPEFIKEAKPERIAKILENKKSKLRYSIAEATVELYKQKKLSDYNVMKDLAEKLGHKNVQSFWNDIEAANI